MAAGDGAPQQVGQAMPEEDVVAKNQAARLAADELAADQQGLSQALGPRLHGVAEAEAPLPAVLEQRLESRPVVRRVAPPVTNSVAIMWSGIPASAVRRPWTSGVDLMRHR